MGIAGDMAVANTAEQTGEVNRGLLRLLESSDRRNQQLTDLITGQIMEQNRVLFDQVMKYNNYDGPGLSVPAPAADPISGSGTASSSAPVPLGMDGKPLIQVPVKHYMKADELGNLSPDPSQSQYIPTGTKR